MLKVTKAAVGLAAVVEQQKADQRAAAAKRYPILIESDSDDPKLAKELHDAMQTLGKDVGQLSADHRTLANVRRLQAVLKNGCGLDAARDATIKAIAAHQLETMAIFEQRRGQSHALQVTSDELGQRFLEAQNALNQLNGILNSHGELLMHEPRPELT